MHSIFDHESQVLLMDVPYTVRVESDHVVVEFHRDAIDHPYLTADMGEQFIGVGTGELRIDCTAVTQANSVMIAWIIRMMNLAKPRHVVLIGVGERHAFLLRRMRLDQLVEIRSTP